MTGVVVREAIAADAPALHRFMAELVAERLPVLYRREAPPSIEEERQFIEALGAVPNSILLLAVVGAEIVGVLDFHGDQRPQAAHGGHFGMSVTAKHRGRRIGRALVEALIAWAPTAGVTRLELQVFDNNANAIHLYERLGFAHEGRRRAAVQVDGRRIDVLLMAREVTRP